MFVTNHVLAGALVGLALPQRPVAAFTVGAVSHVAMDVVHHYGCPKDRFLDVARRDGLLGLAAMAAAATGSGGRARRAVVAGMAGAALLDLNKPAEHFLGFSPFPRAVDDFHVRIQDGKEAPAHLRREVAAGVVLAAAVAAASWARSGRTGT